MKCFNCDYTFKHGDICPSCGADMLIYKKTKNSSIRLYNKGLQQAQEGDLSGAIQSLNQSIIFDKKNYISRNLLGLVYYEVGQISDSLMQWIISSSLKKEDNNAKKYIDSLQNNARDLEKYNDSIRMYNDALNYIYQKSEDLAIIQLKKAIDINPKFVEAINLLALCYISIKSLGKANECIDRALSIDLNNSKALYYLSEINPSKAESSKNIKEKEVGFRPSKENSVYRKNKNSNNSIGKTGVISFIIGVVCTTAVLMTLVMPAWVDGKTEKIKELEVAVTALEDENENGSSKFAESFKTLQDENQILKDENEKLKAEKVTQEKVSKIAEAEASLKNGDSETAAISIIDLDSAGLSEDLIARHNTLKEEAFPEAASSFYTKGKSQYLSNNYDEAVSNLENALKFANGENFVDDCIYYLGKIAQSKDDTEKAKSYYQRIVSEFSDSNQFRNAENGLKALEEQ